MKDAKYYIKFMMSYHFILYGMLAATHIAFSSALYFSGATE